VQPKEIYIQPELFGKFSIVWAEVKNGTKDIFQMFAQLILTIGKAKTFNKYTPPPLLSVFDSEKTIFVPYEKIQPLFFLNNFNWNVAPSNHASKEFAQIKELIVNILETEHYLFRYSTNDRELREFIKNNLAKDENIGKMSINTNNFPATYHKWRKEVLPLIDVNFEHIKKLYGIQDCDFYLAALFIDDTQEVDDQTSLKDNLSVTFYVVRQKGRYEGKYEIRKENIVKTIFEDGVSDKTFSVKTHDKYFKFWSRYERPPREKYHDEIITRRDLLVPPEHYFLPITL